MKTEGTSWPGSSNYPEPILRPNQCACAIRSLTESGRGLVPGGPLILCSAGDRSVRITVCGKHVRGGSYENHSRSSSLTWNVAN